MRIYEVPIRTSSQWALLQVKGVCLRAGDGEFVRETVILGNTPFFLYLWSLIENYKN